MMFREITHINHGGSMEKNMKSMCSLCKEHCFIMFKSVENVPHLWTKFGDIPGFPVQDYFPYILLKYWLSHYDLGSNVQNAVGG